MKKMGGGRVYRGQDYAGLVLRGEGIAQQEIDPLFSSVSASPTKFHGSRSMVFFEDFGATGGVPGAFPRRPEIDEMGEDDLDEYGIHQPEKKRRLTTDQVQYLEKSFEVDNKLEPERKLQLARDLGLQPRQVAIWFQNRRARWKTKQIEKDYETLQSSFNSLKNDYDGLLKEKEKLAEELQVLKARLMVTEKDDTNCAAVSSPLPLSSPPLLLPVEFKPEDLCSADSAVVDFEHIEEAWHSDLSQPDEDDGEKLERSIYGGFEDPWLWP